MRPIVLAGNWKMHTTLSEAISLARAVDHCIHEQSLPSHYSVLLCPPFPFLEPVRQVIQHPSLFLGAQNLYPGDAGAFTGEVSAPMLRSVGCTYVIVGHSERRKIFGETNDLINAKIASARTHQLVPILCVGETWEERAAGKTEAVIEEQLHSGLANISLHQPGELLIAYEPVWAIGTGHAATPEQAQVVHRWIRHWLAQHYGADFADGTPILYGGSVKPANAADLLTQPDIDGALVGGASLKAESFCAIIQAALPS